MSILAPYSSMPDFGDTEISPTPFVGATNSRPEMAMKVAASIAADNVWHLRFRIPPTLPSGTGKLLLVAQANATSGAAKVNPAWASVADAENPDTVTLTAEGTTTLAWTTGDDDDYKQTKITLDADTLVAGEVVVMAITFETTSWTLAAASFWNAFVIWE